MRLASFGARDARRWRHGALLLVAVSSFLACTFDGQHSGRIGGTAPDLPTAVHTLTVATASSPPAISIRAGVGEPVTAAIALRSPDGSPPGAYTLTWSLSGTRASAASGDETLTFVPRVAGTIQVTATLSVCTGNAWAPRADCNSQTFGPATVYVWGVPTSALAFGMTRVTLVPGERRPIQAFATGAGPKAPNWTRGGFVVASERPTYRTDDATIATVDEDGVVTAHALGETLLHAVAGGKTSELAVEVIAGTLGPPPDGVVTALAPDYTVAAPTTPDFVYGIRDGALALDAQRWPAIAFAQPLSSPIARVAVWTGSGFGQEAASAPSDVGIYPHIVRSTDGALWVGYFDMDTQAWVISQRQAPGRWQTTPLPASMDASIIAPSSTTDTEAANDFDVGRSRLAFGFAAASAADPRGGVWAVTTLRREEGFGLMADAERRIRLSHVSDGTVTSEDVAIQCDGRRDSVGAPLVGGDANCLDLRAREPLGGLWLVPSQDTWPRVLALDVTHKLTVYERSADGVWTGHVALPRGNRNAHDDAPAEFAVVRPDGDGPPIWLWIANDARDLSWQALGPSEPGPTLAGERRGTIPGSGTWAGGAAVFGVAASDGAMWMGRRGLAGLTMTRPDGAVTTDEFGPALVGDATTDFDVWSFDRLRSGGMVARADRIHLVYSGGNGISYASFRRIALASVNDSDAPGARGRSIAWGGGEEAVPQAPLVLGDGSRWALVTTASDKQRAQGAAGVESPWSAATTLGTGTVSPVLLAHRDRVYVARTDVAPEISWATDSVAFQPFQSLYSTASIVTLAATDDDAVWALTSDQRVFRTVASDAVAHEFAAAQLPLGIPPEDVGLTTFGTFAYIVTKNRTPTLWGPGTVVVSQLDANGFVQSTEDPPGIEGSQSALSLNGVDVVRPVVTSEGRLCVLRLEGSWGYAGRVLCTTTLFRGVGPDDPTAFERVDIGTGDWIDGTMTRMVDGRLLVMATRRLNALRDQVVVHVSPDGRSWSAPLALRPDGGYGQWPIGCAPDGVGTLLCIVHDNLSHSNWRGYLEPGYPAAPRPVPIAIRIAIDPP